MSLIKISNISKKFNYSLKIGLFKSEKKSTQAIENINFEVVIPSIVTLIGANGAGKTTLIKIMLGLIEPTSGEVKILNQNPYLKKNDYLKRIGFVSGQKRTLNPDLTAFDSILVNGLFYGLTTTEIEERFTGLCKAFNVEEKASVPVRNLSLGETIKFEIIFSIIHKPEILFLDEPTIGLDFESQTTIIRILKKLHEQEKMTILLTSHYPKDIKELSQRIIVLEKGRIIFDDIPAKLNNLSQDSEVNSYLNQLNRELSIYD